MPPLARIDSYLHPRGSVAIPCAILIVAGSLWSCYAPTFPEGLACTADRTCPEGQACGSDDRCYPPENLPACVPQTTFVQEILPEAADISSVFGERLSLGDGRLIIGDRASDSAGVSAGGIYAYTNDGQRFSRTQSIHAADAAASDEFGHDVAFAGPGRLVVGAPFVESSTLVVGAVYVYAHDGSAYVLEQTLLGPLTEGDVDPPLYYGQLGSMVGADDGVIVATALHEEAVYFFEMIGATWTETQRESIPGLLPPNAAPAPGRAVAVVGDRAFVGAARHLDGGGIATGAVLIYQRPAGTSWSLQQTLYPSDGAGGDLFGWSLAVDDAGSLMAVTAKAKDDDGRVDVGAAYVFELVDGMWVETTKLIAPDGAEADSLGESVAVAGNDTVVVGADNAGTENTGAAYVFIRRKDTWLVEKVLAPNAAPGDFFGVDVAVRDDLVMVGAPGKLTGEAYAFARQCE